MIGKRNFTKKTQTVSAHGNSGKRSTPWITEPMTLKLSPFGIGPDYLRRSKEQLLEKNRKREERKLQETNFWPER